MVDSYYSLQVYYQDGINMKKRCYPKYCYILYIILSIVMFIFSLGPLFIKTDDEKVIGIIWSIIMLTFGIFFVISALYSLQYFYIDNDYIIVKSCFGIIEKINIKHAIISVENLPTYFSWIITTNKKWICIYGNSDLSNQSKFKTGCSNKKNQDKVQIIYSDENMQMIKNICNMDG